ncbi:hypothetical protein AV656_01260 [Bhargavaea cecembensis]|uniref:Uncharacterized protein n=1 Tax=Bhargavaea cecembensis TaxID=394098 RepID=A0A163GA01_9BACL|nr:hypothetical protein [Bhargavaea cecembensis]KZE39937.1 hypothetical protein AV656_01260 [Bhargavaea cecembensis]
MIRYIRTERSIRRLQQRTEDVECKLILTEEAVISSERDFALSKVWDMSARPAASRCWFLYLHTDEGVFAFRTEESPDGFISSYREIRN